MVKLHGQGLIEVVFAVGVIVVVLTAVISLVVSSLHARTSGYDRKKAAELGQKVMEKLVQEKDQYPVDFWNVSSPAFWQGNLGTTQTMAGYNGYYYAIGFVQQIDAVGCSAVPVVCANATVGVGYSDNNTQNVVFTRFFSR
jgi:Tfp pilus assembly protein PilV